MINNLRTITTHPEFGGVGGVAVELESIFTVTNTVLNLMLRVLVLK
jgi:hypothetical protein